MPALRVFEVGERYGRLTVIQRRSTATSVLCRCECGNEGQFNAADLVYKIRSCGVCTRTGATVHNWRGGRAKHPLYQTYQGMLARCSRPTHHKYREYGARGITVCERWREDFWNFVADMGERPERTTLNRRDNDGPYSPDNCHWASPTEQARNRRPRRWQSRPPDLTDLFTARPELVAVGAAGFVVSLGVSAA